MIRIENTLQSALRVTIVMNGMLDNVVGAGCARWSGAFGVYLQLTDIVSTNQ